MSRPSNESKKKSSRIESLKGLYLLSTIGLQFLVSILIGLGVGLWLDGRTGKAPLFMAIFLFFGVGAGFVNAYRVASRASARLEREERE